MSANIKYQTVMNANTYVRIIVIVLTYTLNDIIYEDIITENELFGFLLCKLNCFECLDSLIKKEKYDATVDEHNDSICYLTFNIELTETFSFTQKFTLTHKQSHTTNIVVNPISSNNEEHKTNEIDELMQSYNDTLLNIKRLESNIKPDNVTYMPLYRIQQDESKIQQNESKIQQDESKIQQDENKHDLESVCNNIRKIIDNKYIIDKEEIIYKLRTIVNHTIFYCIQNKVKYHEKQYLNLNTFICTSINEYLDIDYLLSLHDPYMELYLIIVRFSKSYDIIPIQILILVSQVFDERY